MTVKKTKHVVFIALKSYFNMENKNKTNIALQM